MTSQTTPEAGNVPSEDTGRTSVDARIVRAVHAAAQERDRATRERRKDYPREVQDMMDTDAWEGYVSAGEALGFDEAQLEALCVAAYREKAARQETPMKGQDK